MNTTQRAQGRSHELCRNVLGVPFDAVTLREAVAWSRQRWTRREGQRIVTVNSSMLVALRSAPLVSEYILQADLRVCDGMFLIWVSRALDAALPERVTGIDLMGSLLSAAAAEGRSAFLLGARPGVAEEAARTFEEAHRGLRIAGVQHGYFGDREYESIVDRIERQSIDLVVLAMGVQREALFIRQLGRRLACGVVIGTGGSLDIAAGRLRRAPKLIQRMGAEWAFRVLQEPARLGPRYVRTGVILTGIVVREFVSGTLRDEH